MKDDEASSSIEQSMEKYINTDISALSPKKMKEVVAQNLSGQRVANPLAQEPAADNSQFAQDNMREMLIKSKKTLDGLFSLAHETQTPRVYDSLAELLRVMTEMNKEISEMDRVIKEGPKGSGAPVPGGTNTQNNFYLGSSEDLNKLLDGLRTEPIIIDEGEEDGTNQ